jgi:Leucine-rich repeat (LRR) protein
MSIVDRIKGIYESFMTGDSSRIKEDDVWGKQLDPTRRQLDCSLHKSPNVVVECVHTRTQPHILENSNPDAETETEERNPRTNLSEEEICTPRNPHETEQNFSRRTK